MLVLVTDLNENFYLIREEDEEYFNYLAGKPNEHWFDSDQTWWDNHIDVNNVENHVGLRLNHLETKDAKNAKTVTARVLKVTYDDGTEELFEVGQKE